MPAVFLADQVIGKYHHYQMRIMKLSVYALFLKPTLGKIRKGHGEEARVW